MAVPIELTGTTADEQVYTGPVRLMGFSVRENAATAAVATALIRDGTTASGRLVVSLELNGDQSATMWYGDEGLRMDTGIYFDRVAGTTTGTVYVK